jgi:two-component system, OmpR family, phosphate regulon sensor histidine kinase PhoR
MDWLLPRLLMALLALALGAGLGHAIGFGVDAPRVGLVVGALGGLALAVALDVARARRLLRWLRGAQADEAPRHTGFWGELAYRMERVLRSRERDLRRERERIEQFLSAIEASPNGVLLLDANDQIEWCNSVAADHLGIDPLRDLRQPLTNLVRAPAFVAQLQSGGAAEAVTFSLPGRPGTLSVLIRPYGNGQKLLLTQDITEGLRTDEMRRDFVANVSHEIRTPLTVLAGFVETLRHIELSAAERERVLAMMAQQTDRMRSLVDDLLTLAQLEGSPRPRTDQWVAVDALLRRVEADARPLSAGRHTLEFAAGDGGAIAGSEAELLSALGNLVTNAIRYTPPGGRILVSWERRGNGSAAFDVRDSGVGVAPEHLARLGERFYRVDGSRSRDSGGTGLGLAIAKHAVQRHGGTLEVESSVGKGSVFRLVFPPARVR